MLRVTSATFRRVLLWGLLLCSPVVHSAYSNVYFFGDSLSDTGNLYTATQGSLPAAPYYNGRFSDGPTWVEALAPALGLSSAAQPSLLGGNNYAWAGAFSGFDGRAGAGMGLLSQYGYWQQASGGIADPDALYVLAIGSNDLHDLARANNGTEAEAESARLTGAQTVMSNVSSVLDGLWSAGARRFLVANVPDLGLTPGALGGGYVASATHITLAYNDLLVSFLDDFAGGETELFRLDLSSILHEVVADVIAGGDKYGLSNAVIPCFAQNAPACAESVFVDTIHPTAFVHALAAERAISALVQPVSEPGVLALAALGLGVLMSKRGRSALPA